MVRRQKARAVVASSIRSAFIEPQGSTLAVRPAINPAKHAGFLEELGKEGPSADPICPVDIVVSGSASGRAAFGVQSCKIRFGEDSFIQAAKVISA